MMNNYKEKMKSILEYLKQYFKDNLISIVLYGSYARNEQKDTSDIDLLIIVETPTKLDDKKKQFFIENKIQPLVMTKSEFKYHVIKGNSQLIPIFYEGIILYDKGKFFEKNKKLFIILHKEKNIRVIYKNKEWTMRKLITRELF